MPAPRLMMLHRMAWNVNAIAVNASNDWDCSSIDRREDRWNLASSGGDRGA